MLRKLHIIVALLLQDNSITQTFLQNKQTYNNNYNLETKGSKENNEDDVTFTKQDDILNSLRLFLLL